MQDAADLVGDERGQAGQVHVALERREGRQLAGLLGDRRRVVAHPLELVGHVVEREQEAQVAGDRPLGRDGRGDDVGDLDLDLVDAPVADDDRRGRRLVVRDERLERLADLDLDHRAHAQDAVLGLAHLAIERRARDLEPWRWLLAGRAVAGLDGHGPAMPRSRSLIRTVPTRSPRSAGWPAG